MKISVVTISYNQAKYLWQCMDSVLNQNYPDIEYIIVDPGSTDGSREIIDSYDDRVIRVYEKDAGPADGLNKGFARATGNVLGFLNSDDVLQPNALRTIGDWFESHPTYDVVSGCGTFVDAEGKFLKSIVPSKLTPWLYAHGGVSVFQQGTFFRAPFFKKVGGFNLENKTCWDGELFLDMAIAGARFATIGADLAQFRLHAEGITGSGRLEEKYRKDSARLFLKVKGRERNNWDGMQDKYARILKCVVDPAYFFRRIKTGCK
jgi:glycosyltransferase involved in cell wall biosynthesis